MGFFKAYDMRGTFGVDFDLPLVERIGRALPKVVKGSRWLVGRDCRVTGADVKAALVKGLLDAGADVDDIGLCSTPMVYFCTGRDGYDGSVMVTASHNPPADNGLKVSMKTALPVGYANGLDEVEKLASTEIPDAGVSRRGRYRFVDGAVAPYVEWMKSRVDTGSLKGLRYAVDCSNGMASLFASGLFPGATVINGTLDGSFPAHSPNPLKADAREEISRLVHECSLDCGVIFDGDADRAMFVDGTGAFVQPDYLVPVVAKATGAKRGDRIIHDVRTSRGAVDAIRAMGCEPVMVPVGHAFAKPILRREKALCGGELAGHYYFSEFYGCDSGVLAALRILSEIAKAKAAGLSFAGMMKPISAKWANSGELNFKVGDKDAAIGRVLSTVEEKFPDETGRETMDGIRIEFAEGWISVRKSNTEPYLRLLVECDTSARLEEWKSLLVRAIDKDGESC
ncbi:MAG: phosphomannomutase/phosphoglucomutase [Kiritimatiellae bacterium]|nr:phosphomannomutase/phosphoglucomutase [Kiritimatiellia bacterium]